MAAPENQPITRAAPGTTETRTVSYSYDGLLRLTGATESGATTNSYAYGYDLAGNRTSTTANGATTTQSYNAANQVVGWSYDAAGNLLSDGTTTYGYDALNRLVTQDTTTNVYNGDDVLVQRGTTQYAQDLVATLSQVLTDGTATYVYGHERLAALGQAWYVGDALGSVRQTLDATGAVQATANDAPFGAPQGSTIAPFGFTGELHDQGLVNLRARWYDPRSGVFTGVDPFSGFPETPYSLNPYQYVYSAPTTWTDPSGWCVAYLNYQCTAVQTWADLEAMFPYGYVRPPAETAANPHWNAPLPREVAEWAAMFDLVTTSSAYATGQYNVDMPFFGGAELFSTYVLGVSLLAADSPYAQGLTTELACLDEKLDDGTQTTADVLRRLAILGTLGMLNGQDGYNPSGSGTVGGGGPQFANGGGGGGGGKSVIGRSNPSGYNFVSTPKGTIVPIPSDWPGRPADNGRGTMYQHPHTTTRNGDMIRIMDPTPQYPNGYVRYSNRYGQWLDVNGKSGPRSATHIPLDYEGPLPQWPK